MDALCNRRSNQPFTRPGRTLAPAIALAIAATLAVGAWLLAGFLIAVLMGPFGADRQSSAVTVATHPAGFDHAANHPAAAVTASSPTPDLASVPGASADWWSQAQAELERREYRPSADAGFIHAVNRAQNLRARFSEAGVDLHPRTISSGNPWQFSWRTTGFGRADRMTAIAAPARPAVDGTRVTYTHASAAGALSEWYVNRAEGLEQGFTVHERPSGQGRVRIEGTLADGIRAQANERGAITFFDEDDAPVLEYGALHVFDAHHEEVPATLALAGNTLSIVIDDRGAEYPLLVDPIFTAPAWISDLDQFEGGYGFAVATAGDVNGDGYSDVLVSALQYDNGETNEGGAFLFMGSANGLATKSDWSVESNQVEGRLSQIGAAGDVNGDGYGDVMIGDFAWDNIQLNAANAGKALLFLGSPSGLATTPAWTVEGTQANAWFGNSVGTAGDVNSDGFDDVIIGQYNYDNGQNDEGRALVYHGSASGLSATPAWITEANQEDAYYGYLTSTAGDVNGDGFADVIVSALFYDNDQDAEGRAFVYLGSAAGLSTTPSWTGEGNQNACRTTSVSTAGDVNGDGYSDVIIGHEFYDNPDPAEGKVSVFMGSAAGLATTAAWNVEGNQENALLGYRVGTAGDVNGDGYADVIIAAFAYDNGHTDEGRAYVYQGGPTGLSTSPIWIGEPDQNGARVLPVATAGDVNGDGFSDVIFGSYQYDGPQTDSGRAFLYYGRPDGLAINSGWTGEPNQAGAGFGFSVTTAGDVNGDGYSDLVVGANSYDNGQSQEGAAFVYHGGPAGFSNVAAWRAEGNQVDALFGSAVASAGDVNGDGYSDVLVGAYWLDNGQVDEGKAFLYLGSPSGLAVTPAWTAESNQVSAQFGWAVEGAGDVNGDGFSDVIVGADLFDNDQTDEGRAFTYLGSPAGLSTNAAWTAEGNRPGAGFGGAVAGAGDVNGDGFSDVIVGASTWGNGQQQEGRAFAYLGSAAGLALTPAWGVESNQIGAVFGISVASAGDVNGDKFSDVIVGADMYDNADGDEGAAFVYHGSAAGLATTHAWMTESNDPGSHYGHAVATAGDVNGDGFSDVVVGAYLFDIAGDSGGRAFVYHGAPSGLSTQTAWLTQGPQGTSFLGLAVGSAGDVNGDGFGDLIVGSPGFTNGESMEGRALLYYGNGGDGPDRIARQARTDNTAPIDVLGLSDSQTGVRLKALGRTPLGRGGVRLEIEVKPFGVPFDGTGLTIGPWLNTGTPGAGGSAVALNQLRTSLDPGTLYHWRARIGTKSPYFLHSPWLVQPYNGATEADFRTGGATMAVSEEKPSPGRSMLLEAASPNPFSAATSIGYSLPQAGRSRLAVYDVLGRQVALLLDGAPAAGRHEVRWEGRDHDGRALPAGTYFIRLEFNGQSEARKVVLAR